jgi:hypothetical protein
LKICFGDLVTYSSPSTNSDDGQTMIPMIKDKSKTVTRYS